jgi:hypothetical protein
MVRSVLHGDLLASEDLAGRAADGVVLVALVPEVPGGRGVPGHRGDDVEERGMIATAEQVAKAVEDALISYRADYDALALLRSLENLVRMVRGV